MVTNYYPRIVSDEGLRSAEESSAPVFDWLRQTLCGLHGHDALLHFEQERMSLRCTSCGHQTPGWELNEVKPTITVHGDARRHAIVRPQLVGARRIA